MVWPLSGRELAEALGAEIHASRGDSVLTSALAGRERRGVGGDVFFAIRPDLLPLVPQMLADGAELAVVPAEWLAARIVSPEMRTRYVPVESPLRAFRQLGAFMRRRFSFPVIAVGGSNGKTTTKEMIAAVLGSSGHTVTKTPGTNNGWVGTPISLCHPAHREGTLPSALVLEIGIDEIGAMESHVRIASPDLSVLTALEKEHLEGLRSLEICVREEMKLFAVPRRVWLADDPELRAHLGEARAGDVVVHDAAAPVSVPCPTVAYAWRALGPEGGALDLAFHDGAKEVTRLAVEVPLPGRHNGTNAALAFAVGFALGRNLHELHEGFRAFVPPGQRTELVALACGGLLIDDTYNASPASMAAALAVLRAFPHRVKVLVLGDMLDLGTETAASHRELATNIESLARERVSCGDTVHVRLYGNAMHALGEGLSRKNFRSFACLREEGDPKALLDLPDYDDAVVLVKGSRGMRMERVASRLRELGRDTWDASTTAVVVVGADDEDLARQLRALVSPEVRVRALSVRATIDGLPPFTVAVFAGMPTSAADPEQELARMAQPFLRLGSGATAVLPADNEAAGLLAEIVPPHARVLRVGATEGKTALLRATLDALATVLASNARVP